MSEALRSFIAFDIDDERIIRRLSEAQDRLINTGANLNLVKPQNIHVTLRFLGDVSPSMVDPIYEAMKKVSFASFDVDIRGVGTFPSLSYIRVIWAGIRRGAEELRGIFSQLEPQLRSLGFRADPKGFSPHLTIARVRAVKNKAELLRCIRDLEDYEFGTLKAEFLRLKRSVLTPRGPIYSILHEVGALRG